jgi:hypothetical protein
MKINDMKYTLCSGTLLGYARGRNILRWDDDIDVFIPPENFSEAERNPMDTEKIIPKFLAIRWENYGLKL